MKELKISRTVTFTESNLRYLLDLEEKNEIRKSDFINALIEKSRKIEK